MPKINWSFFTNRWLPSKEIGRLKNLLLSSLYPLYPLYPLYRRYFKNSPKDRFLTYPLLDNIRNQLAEKINAPKI